MEINKPSRAVDNPLTIKDYQGGKSTLCTGCGHDSVTGHIIKAFFEAGIDPTTVAKLSGIGCSSKTPAYFMNQAHGFNTIHGRMASVAVGAKIANRNLNVIGVSGDGDTASIGLGGFLHLVRRNLPMIYIIENNGVYGLTKGQFSATADYDVPQKKSSAHHVDTNPFSSLDLCALAIESGCEFVARSFSGDAKQLIPLLKAALYHPGTAVIDVISPCITYANHDGSTKSYDYVKEHKVSLQDLGFILGRDPVEAEYSAGEHFDIELSHGAFLRLKKAADSDIDVQNKMSALKALEDSRQKNQILTGLLYCRPKALPLTETLRLPATPLRDFKRQDLAPTQDIFEKLLTRFR